MQGAIRELLRRFLTRHRIGQRFQPARKVDRKDGAVRARVAQADETRLAAITALFARYGYDGDEADVRARTIYLVQIGYISMQVEEDLETRLARFPHYVQTYTGQPPTTNEMARFTARFR